MYIIIIINILLCSSRSYSVTSVSYAVCALFCFDFFVFGICFVFRSLHVCLTLFLLFLRL